MSQYNPDEYHIPSGRDFGEPPILAEVVGEPLWRPAPVYRPRRGGKRRVLLPLSLFIATCLSTFYAGVDQVEGFSLQSYSEAAVWTTIFKTALEYAVPLMIILVCHEMGHFLQARRYGVHASYPYFIPMPFSPIGTFGAVIGMEAHMGHRRALFDIGISGPLAGLVPTLFFCVVGILKSQIVPSNQASEKLSYGTPLLFQILEYFFSKTVPLNFKFDMHPMAFAGWVGLLITSLNLIPVGQLDGGHILYALLRNKARRVATIVLLLAIAAACWQSYMHGTVSPWTLMLFLLVLMGPMHPPTADDNEPLGVFRYILGWLTLAFIFIGFTPNPLPMGP
jgi:membrane-associated protease RseP (regulator of RpoE activity)